MENETIRTKTLREKYSKNMLTDPFSKDGELKEREELIYKPIMVSKDDMDKFEEQQME